jgi:hypothetical protein
MSVTFDPRNVEMTNNLIFPNEQMYNKIYKHFVLILTSILRKPKIVGSDASVDKIISLYLSSSQLKHTNPQLATQSLFAATLAAFELFEKQQ